MRKGSFLQQDVSRAIKAARVGGLAIASVVIDTCTGHITINSRDGVEVPLVDSKKGKTNDSAALDPQSN